MCSTRGPIANFLKAAPPPLPHDCFTCRKVPKTALKAHITVSNVVTIVTTNALYKITTTGLGSEVGAKDDAPWIMIPKITIVKTARLRRVPPTLTTTSASACTRVRPCVRKILAEQRAAVAGRQQWSENGKSEEGDFNIFKRTEGNAFRWNQYRPELFEVNDQSTNQLANNQFH